MAAGRGSPGCHGGEIFGRKLLLQLGVEIFAHGDEITISGEEEAVRRLDANGWSIRDAVEQEEVSR